ncbi:MAG: radical SAM protein [Thermoplasmatales archaeon]|nr:MAG: radical SAM protein [Thermoplasmatales archaeon]
MKINEIFYSIQGEGKLSGIPTIFIRVSGCNLRCSYCDTQYAYDNGTEMDINNIINEIKKYHCNNVCLTGGEPLLYSNIKELITKLINNKYKVSIETNGSINIIPILKTNILISLDIKCPSSKMDGKMILENLTLLKKKDQLKFIIKNKQDYDYAKKIIETKKLNCDVFFQPVWGFNPKIIAEWILKDGLNVKLGLQIHKIIWGEKRRT